MDGNRFDDLTRGIASRSRRAVLKSAIGAITAGVLVATGLRETDAASKRRKNGETCRSNSDCQEGVDCSIAADGRRRCLACVKNNCDVCSGGEACAYDIEVSCGTEFHCAIVETAECETTCVERECDGIACKSSEDCPLDSYCIRIPGCCSDDLESFFCSYPCGFIFPTSTGATSTSAANSWR